MQDWTSKFQDFVIVLVRIYLDRWGFFLSCFLLVLGLEPRALPI